MQSDFRHENTGWELLEPPDEASYQSDDEPDQDILDALQEIFEDDVVWPSSQDFDEEMDEFDGWYERLNVAQSPAISEQDLALLEKVRRGEYLDATGRIPLFADTVVAEDEHGVRFTVPERVICSEKYGAFALELSGKYKHFKEHDDYGTIRSLAKDGRVSGAIWVPHLYPFEEVNPNTNMPIIPDRERCSFMLNLRRIGPGREAVPRPRELAVHTSEGIFASLPDPGISISGGADFYTEFHWYQHAGIAQEVEYPDIERPSVTAFLGELAISDNERFERLLNGQEELPDEFEKWKVPLDHSTRKPWANNSGMQAFGDIWVPIDVLRLGNDAEVEFLMFQR